MDRYCGQCGQAAVDDAQFCMSCGDRISPADPTPRPATVALRESGQISSAEPDFRPAAVSSHRGQLTDPPQRYAAYPVSQPSRPIIVALPKSPAVAAILGFLFGPLGLLYASGKAALIMFGVNVAVAIFTLGFGLFLTWPVSAIVGYVAATNYNQRLAGAPVVGVSRLG